jgi:hypothetical protein
LSLLLLAAGTIAPLWRRARPTPRPARYVPGCHATDDRWTPRAAAIGRNCRHRHRDAGARGSFLDRDGLHSKGFSDDEVKAIAAWYGAQRD